MEKQLIVAALAALAQETRLDVFQLLVRSGPRGLPAGSIGSHLDIPSATLSFHLKELKSAGLIRCERRGRSRIYSPEFSTINDVMAYLTSNCCRGVDATDHENGAIPGCDVEGRFGC